MTGDRVSIQFSDFLQTIYSENQFWFRTFCLVFPISDFKLNVNPRPAGPLDFSLPAGGGGGRLNAPPPHDLGSWSP